MLSVYKISPMLFPSLLPRFIHIGKEFGIVNTMYGIFLVQIHSGYIFYGYFCKRLWQKG